MTIAELAARSKSALDRIPRHFLVIAVVVLSSSASFGLGILEGRELGQKEGIVISQIPTTTPEFLQSQGAPRDASGQAAAVYLEQGREAVPDAPPALPAGGEVVASKSGTKYYFPWCGTVKLIKEENKVWFASREAAEAAGYEPASNCKGL